jgi:multidrug efflux pump subunit AcrA (membrane-fusion protein)
LHTDASGDFVWLVRDDAVEKRSVKIAGQRDRAQILVVSGLNIGDTIVRSSEATLTPGQSIKTK